MIDLVILIAKCETNNQILPFENADISGLISCTQEVGRCSVMLEEHIVSRARETSSILLLKNVNNHQQLCVL